MAAEKTREEMAAKMTEWLYESTQVLADKKSDEPAVQEQIRRNCETLVKCYEVLLG